MESKIVVFKLKTKKKKNPKNSGPKKGHVLGVSALGLPYLKHPGLKCTVCELQLLSLPALKNCVVW